MNQLLFYLLQVIAASGLLYGYYHFALRNKKFHRYNRFYLMMAVVISALIPFLNIPVYFSASETESSVVLQTLQVISSPAVEEAVTPALQTEPVTGTWFNAERLVYLFYILAILIFLIRVFISLNKIRLIIKKNSAEQIDKIKFINTDEPGTPFSFFRWLFWNRKIEIHSEKGEQIFRHELFHIQQKHSWDIIFMELISTIFWINPFFHLIKKEIKAIHEFLADEFAIKENRNWQYAELLLMQVLNTNTHLVNPFFHNQIKRRIAMITTSTKPSYQYLRKLMVLPVAAIIFFLFAFSYKNRKNDPHEFEKAINSITVVIDAGHGGTDGGAKTKDGKYKEAALSLAIAKKIEALAHDYNINVIMTRDDKNFPGWTTNKNDALRKRVEISNNVRPHAFISIHLNTNSLTEQNSKTGFEAYITNQQDNPSDIKLATSILGELKNVYKAADQIQRRKDNAGIYVIDNSISPSVHLECGYINNPMDIAFITKESNQEDVARAILKGLVSFANSSTSKIMWDDEFIKGYVNDTTKEELIAINRLKNSLLVIDGVIQPGRGFYSMDSNLILENRIEELRVFWDKAATDKYGEHGKEGVIEISTQDHQYPDTLPRIKNVTLEPPQKNITDDKLKSWGDRKMYGIWIDDNWISNGELKKYMPSDFAWYDVKKVEPDAVDYGKYKYRVNLVTKRYNDKQNSLTKHGSEMPAKEIWLTDTTKPKKDEPLIVIDGKPRPDLNFSKIETVISVDKIESMNVLKGQNATAKYGDMAKYGVIEINTKKTKTDEVIVNGYKTQFDDDNKVFEKVEVEAAFRGGEREWRNFLNRNLDVNVPVKNGCKPGTYTVTVQFIVAKDGRVSDVRALTNHGFGMEEEAMRMIKKGPDWIPAIQNGHNVKAYRKQPFTFVITKPITNVDKIPIEKVRTIEQEKTNSKQILSLFDEPGSKSIDNHYIYWTYTNGSAKLDILYERSTERVNSFHFAAIINPVKRNVDYDKVKTIKQGQSTLAEVEKMYGLPYKLEIDNNNESWYYEGHNSRLAVLSTNRKSGVISDLRYN